MAYGLRLAELDEARDITGGVFTADSDSREQKTNASWTPLGECDLVLVRKLEVTKNLSRKHDAQWESAFQLVDVSRHLKSGRLYVIITGEMVKARKGGLADQTHVNNMKLFYARGNGLPHDANHITIEAVWTAADWEPGEENGDSLGRGLARWQALVLHYGFI